MRLTKRRVWVLTALAVGFGVAFVVWNSKTFRLEVDGASVVWVPFVSFGAIWTARERTLQTAGGLVGGVLVGPLAYLLSIKLLPINPFGLGIGLGVGAAALVCAALFANRVVTMPAAVMGFGIGAGFARVVGVRPTTGFGDLFDVWMACGMAIALGAFGAQALRATVDLVSPAEGEQEDEEEETTVGWLEGEGEETGPLRLRAIPGHRRTGSRRKPRAAS